jgi:hypothetical protein
MLQNFSPQVRALKFFSLAIVWTGLLGSGSWAQALTNPGSLDLSATQTATVRGFEKFLYSFPVPAMGVGLKHISGKLSLQSNSPVFTEALISAHYMASEHCPNSGSHYTGPNAYSQIFSTYPLQGIQNWILKTPTSGLSEIQIDETFETPLNIGGCLVLIFDGGPPTGKANITMSSRLRADYLTPTEANSNYVLGGGSEFCFGQNHGCQASSASPQATFYYAQPITQNSALSALAGNISVSSFDGSKNYGPLPVGPWTFTTDFYFLPDGCGPFTPGPSSQAGDYDSQLPHNAQALMTVVLSSQGKNFAQTPVFKKMNDLEVNAGSCLVAVNKHTGNGAFDYENQVSFLMRARK